MPSISTMRPIMLAGPMLRQRKALMTASLAEALGGSAVWAASGLAITPDNAAPTARTRILRMSEISIGGPTRPERTQGPSTMRYALATRNVVATGAGSVGPEAAAGGSPNGLSVLVRCDPWPSANIRGYTVREAATPTPSSTSPYVAAPATAPPPATPRSSAPQPTRSNSPRDRRPTSRRSSRPRSDRRCDTQTCR